MGKGLPYSTFNGAVYISFPFSFQRLEWKTWRRLIYDTMPQVECMGLTIDFWDKTLFPS